MPSCAQCQGRGFVGFDMPREDPRFGQIVPCSQCQGANNATVPQAKPWDDPGDLYDFPVSADFLAWAGAMGYCPQYPDGRWFPTPEPEDKDYNSESWWRKELASSPGWWHEGTKGQRDKGIKEAKPEKHQNVAKRPPRMSTPKIT